MTVRCLIVDDSQRFRDAARGVLERQGMTVVTLVDINLGDESGFDVAGQLSRRGHVAASSILLISADAELDYADLIAASPVAGFLAKSELSADAIRDLLRPHDGDPVDPFSAPQGR
jgi:hypothetical protein